MPGSPSSLHGADHGLVVYYTRNNQVAQHIQIEQTENIVFDCLGRTTQGVIHPTTQYQRYSTPYLLESAPFSSVTISSPTLYQTGPGDNLLPSDVPGPNAILSRA
jgi:hypothetical protein